MKSIAIVASMVLAFNIFGVTIANASPEPEIYECPGSHAHVWNKDQCPKINPLGGGAPTGGGACGLVCGIGKLLGGVLGL